MEFISYLNEHNITIIIILIIIQLIALFFAHRFVKKAEKFRDETKELIKYMEKLNKDFQERYEP